MIDFYYYVVKMFYIDKMSVLKMSVRFSSHFLFYSDECLKHMLFVHL